MNKISKKITTISAILVIIAVSFFAGLHTNYERVNALDWAPNVVNKDSEISAKLDFSTFWKVWEIMNKKHVLSGTASSTPDQEKIYGAIQGLVDSLGDPYSEFMPPDRSNQFDEELAGSIEGIGVVVGIRNKLLTVISPVKDSPADKAGIRAEDVILKINDEDATSMTVSEAVKRIKGKKGTSVKLTVGRKDTAALIDFTINRDTIIIPTLEKKVLPGKVFVITLNEFNAVSSDLFKDAMVEFYDGGYKKLILDLRNNPGGYLEAAVNMASFFVPEGKSVVTEDYGNKRPSQIHRSKGFATFGNNKKMAVLINAGSASASEILAGALQDYGIAVLVGEKSFGKGSIQELIPITKDTQVKITVGYWLTPNGRSISKEGLNPNFTVEPTEEQIKNGKDVQFDKALELVK